MKLPELLWPNILKFLRPIETQFLFDKAQKTFLENCMYCSQLINQSFVTNVVENDSQLGTMKSHSFKAEEIESIPASTTQTVARDDGASIGYPATVDFLCRECNIIIRPLSPAFRRSILELQESVLSMLDDQFLRVAMLVAQSAIDSLKSSGGTVCLQYARYPQFDIVESNLRRVNQQLSCYERDIAFKQRLYEKFGTSWTRQYLESMLKSGLNCFMAETSQMKSGDFAIPTINKTKEDGRKKRRRALMDTGTLGNRHSIIDQIAR